MHKSMNICQLGLDEVSKNETQATIPTERRCISVPREVEEMMKASCREECRSMKTLVCVV